MSIKSNITDPRPSAGITIVVKVDPVVREWLLLKNNNFPVIKFRQGDTIIKLIHSWLQKSNRQTRLRYHKEESISIYVPTCLTKNIYKSCHLSSFRQKMLNDYLKDAFKTEFYKHVIDKIEEGYNQRQAIQDFLFFYNINNSIINFDMLKKAWDRSNDKENYYKNVNNKMKLLSYTIPVLLDFAFVFDYILSINCPQFINT